MATLYTESGEELLTESGGVLTDEDALSVEASAPTSLAGAQDASYQGAGRLTASMGTPSGGLAVLSGHRLPGSTVTVTVG